MKQEEMNLGDILYKADVIDLPDGTQKIYVRKFEITQCGDQKFQAKGERWTEQGFWRSHSDFISSLQRTPEQAVAHLERKTEHDLTRAREQQARQYKRTEEIRGLITEWRNKKESK